MAIHGYERCGVRDGSKRVGGDGREYACCCNLPAGHVGCHRFLGLTRPAPTLERDEEDVR